MTYDCIAANAALTLLNVIDSLLNNQIESQLSKFQNEGGFTENLYKMRTQSRKKL